MNVIYLASDNVCYRKIHTRGKERNFSVRKQLNIWNRGPMALIFFQHMLVQRLDPKLSGENET